MRGVPFTYSRFTGPRCHSADIGPRTLKRGGIIGELGLYLLFLPVRKEGGPAVRGYLGNEGKGSRVTSEKVGPKSQ